MFWLLCDLAPGESSRLLAACLAFCILAGTLLTFVLVASRPGEATLNALDCLTDAECSGVGVERGRSVRMGRLAADMKGEPSGVASTRCASAGTAGDTR